MRSTVINFSYNISHLASSTFVINLLSIAVTIVMDKGCFQDSVVTQINSFVAVAIVEVVRRISSFMAIVITAEVVARIN